MWSWSKTNKNHRANGNRELDSLARNPELQIRSLFDDPALRRLIGLDQAPASAAVNVRTIKERPQRPFGRRQLLEGAAA